MDVGVAGEGWSFMVLEVVVAATDFDKIDGEEESANGSAVPGVDMVLNLRGKLKG